MAIAIAVLQTGERVITELQEVREDNKEDGKPICLMFVRPYILNTESVNTDANQEVQVRFSKWLPYSSDTQFKIPFTSVMAVGTADPGLGQAYNNTVQQAVAAEDAARAQQTPPPEEVSADTGMVPAEETTPPEGILPDGSMDPDHDQDTTT
tara:strand:+ start:49 stop:504 length:456 start_codon:yes stop_codon:yes gene_type:complete